MITADVGNETKLFNLPFFQFLRSIYLFWTCPCNFLQGDFNRILNKLHNTINLFLYLRFTIFCLLQFCWLSLWELLVCFTHYVNIHFKDFLMKIFHRIVYWCVHLKWPKWKWSKWRNAANNIKTLLGRVKNGPKSKADICLCEEGCVSTWTQ